MPLHFTKIHPVGSLPVLLRTDALQWILKRVVLSHGMIASPVFGACFSDKKALHCFTQRHRNTSNSEGLCGWCLFFVYGEYVFSTHSSGHLEWSTVRDFCCFGVNISVYSHFARCYLLIIDSYSIFISMLSVATSFLITYIGYLNFLRVGDDLTMTEDEEASASATGEAGGGPPEEPTTFRLFYDFVMGRRSHKSKRCATQAQALRTVLRVSLVVSVLYMLQALGFLYKLAVVTMDMKSVECLKFGGSYYFIVLVVYVLPEFFPALVIMHSVSSPTSVFRRPILMTWENFLAIVHCKGKAGFTSDHSLCMLICTNFLSCCGACRGSKKRNLSSTSDGDEENGDGAEGARPALRRIESVSEDITPDFDDINKIEMAARKQSVSSSSRRLSDNPLHGDGKI